MKLILQELRREQWLPGGRKRRDARPKEGGECGPIANVLVRKD